MPMRRPVLVGQHPAHFGERAIVERASKQGNYRFASSGDSSREAADLAEVSIEPARNRSRR